MYQSMFLWLNEAATLIARQLAEARPMEYTDGASALDIARKQLVQALFDGAVRSEGVLWGVDPGPEDPLEPPPHPEPAKWEQIEAGWWSHERYEPYTATQYGIHKSLGFKLEPGGPQLGLSDSVHSSNEEPCSFELPAKQAVSDAYLLDDIVVSWDTDALDFSHPQEEYSYGRIRVHRVDVETHFGVREAQLQPTQLGQLTDTDASPAIRERTGTDVTGKAKTKPATVRTAVYTWLDDRRQKDGPDWIGDKSDSWLADRYSRTAVAPIGHSGSVRKLIGAWRKEHGLTRNSQ